MNDVLAFIAVGVTLTLGYVCMIALLQYIDQLVVRFHAWRGEQ